MFLRERKKIIKLNREEYRYICATDCKHFERDWFSMRFFSLKIQTRHQEPPFLQFAKNTTPSLISLVTWMIKLFRFQFLQSLWRSHVQRDERSKKVARDSPTPLRPILFRIFYSLYSDPCVSATGFQSPLKFMSPNYHARNTRPI